MIKLKSVVRVNPRTPLCRSKFKVAHVTREDVVTAYEKSLENSVSTDFIFISLFIIVVFVI